MAILVVVSLISFLPFFPAIKGILRIGAWGCRLFLNGFELTAKAFAAIPGSYAEISFPSAVSGIISVLCVSVLFYSLAFAKRKNADIWASVSAVLPYSLTLISALVCEIAGIR